MIYKPDNLFFQDNYHGSAQVADIRQTAATFRLPCHGRQAGGYAYGYHNIKSPAKLMTIIDSQALQDLNDWDAYTERHYMYLQPTYLLNGYIANITIPSTGVFGGIYDGSFAWNTCPWTTYRYNSANYVYDYLLPMGTTMQGTAYETAGPPIRFLVMRAKDSNRMIFLPVDSMYYGAFGGCRSISDEPPVQSVTGPHCITPMAYLDNGTANPFFFPLSDHMPALDASDYAIAFQNGTNNQPLVCHGVVGYIHTDVTKWGPQNTYFYTSKLDVPFAGWRADFKKKGGPIGNDFVTTMLP